MKVTVVEDSAFSPFTLKVKVETLDELRELYHRMNVGCSHVIGGSGNGSVQYPAQWATTSEFYRILAEKLRQPF